MAGEDYVWPSSRGSTQGRSVAPLHRCALACADDPDCYAALALIDALRVGRVRDRLLARDLLQDVIARGDREEQWLVARRQVS